MNKINTIFCIIALLAFSSIFTYAGNKDRVGSAGATELLINPWARSSGMHGAYTSGVQGIEAMRYNVGGLAFTKGTELVFANTQWLSGSGVSMNAFGFAQRMSESGVLGVNVVSFSFGEIPITTTDQPDADFGATYKPQFIQLGLAYSKSFSSSIHGGIVVRLVNEAIADARASGVAFDAGLQYTAGERDRVKFGIALRNVGTPLTFSGDGLTVKLDEEYNSINVNQRAEKFELPSLLNIGASYDFHIGNRNRITLAGNFTSNSFRKDQVGAGLEFSLQEKFMLRVGYQYEEGMFEADTRTSALNGLAAGVSVEVPMKKGSSNRFGLDYSYRTTDFWSGIHSLGIRIGLGGAYAEEVPASEEESRL